MEAVNSYFNERQKSGSWSADIKRIQAIRPWIGEFLHDVTPETGQTIKTTLQLRGLAGSTINRHLTILIAILNHAVDMGWLDVAPRIKKLKEGPGRLEFLTPEEVQSFMAALNEQVHKDFVTLAIATGMRMRNITHLEWADVNLFTRVIAIDATKTKNRRPLVIPINQMAMDVLKRLQRPSGRVLQYRGRDLDSIGGRAFKNAQKRAGITKNIHPHIFRHTFASWHIAKGTDVYTLKELGGWKKLDSLDKYVHLNIDHLKQASEQIEHALSV